MKDTALGALGIAFDIAVGASEAFTPLKAVLGVISAIYKNHQVRLRPFAPNTVLTNPSTGNSRCQGKDSTPLLTRGRTGDNFRRTCERRGGATPPGWTVGVCHCSPSILGADSFPANLRSSRSHCGRCPGSQGCGGSLTTFETTGMCPTYSRIYGRPSSTSRFVHDLGAVLDVDRNNRWCNKWRSTSMRAPS